MRGYGQSGCPDAISAYDISRLVGDLIGLMNALNEKSAVLVDQDWGSPIVYNTALMRPFNGAGAVPFLRVVRGLLGLRLRPTYEYSS